MIDKILPLSWLNQEGKEGDIILTSRIRLARNISTHFFSSTATRRELIEIKRKVKSVIESESYFSDYYHIKVDSLSKLDKFYLVEMRLITPQFIDSSAPKSLFVEKGGSISIMVNEEDHLRLQIISGGLSLTASWRKIREVDEKLSEHLEYAFSHHFGFLTACLTNTGTGLRASVFCHLPALFIVHDFNRIINSISSTGISVRGFYGEGSDVHGNIFQISNQATLGESEEEIIKKTERIARAFVKRERDARKILLKESPVELRDKIEKSLLKLKRIKSISTKELLGLLSLIRMGRDLGMIYPIEIKELNKLLFSTQPAHIQRIKGEILSSSMRDRLRARYIRDELKNIEILK
ncbi:MAG: ATP--guanido phosphotransferase [Fidelibacterota bacterium]